MGGSWSKVEFIRQAFVLMTERVVSAIDKRTDAEINRQLRLAGIHFQVGRFTLCFKTEVRGWKGCSTHVQTHKLRDAHDAAKKELKPLPTSASNRPFTQTCWHIPNIIL